MNIEICANIGDPIYYLKKITKRTCPVCDGTGQVTIGKPISRLAQNTQELVEQISDQFIDVMKGKFSTYECPECHGKRTIEIKGRQPYEVIEGKIAEIMAITNETGNLVCYGVYENNRKWTLRDTDCWLDKSKAKAECDFRNLERRMVSIESVQIPKCFADTIPRSEKLMKRLDEWRKNRQNSIERCNTEIRVDGFMNLFDGYTTYLVYKMFGLTSIPVVVFPNGK